MVRTCETTIHTFKNHPNRDKIKFIVLPNIKEGLDLNNDVLVTYSTLRRRIDPLLIEHNLNFDFSLMFSGFGLSELAQVNVISDFSR